MVVVIEEFVDPVCSKAMILLPAPVATLRAPMCPPYMSAAQLGWLTWVHFEDHDGQSRQVWRWEESRDEGVWCCRGDSICCATNLCGRFSLQGHMCGSTPFACDTNTLATGERWGLSFRATQWMSRKEEECMQSWRPSAWSIGSWWILVSCQKWAK